jgi:c-di-GMP-binding flagellar brake protein YcgR
LDKKPIRKYPRVAARFPVRYSVGDKAFRSHATTLGGGGLFLQESGQLPPGAEILVRFRPAKHLRFIEARARVRYQIPGEGVGIEFVEVREEDHQRLLRFIHYRTGDRRRHARVPLVTQVYCEELMWLAFSRDISVGGMFVETKQAVAPGTRLTIRFHLEEGDPIVEAIGIVKYVVPKLGVGVQFFDIEPVDRKRLTAYVGKTPPLPDPTSKAAP